MASFSLCFPTPRSKLQLNVQSYGESTGFSLYKRFLQFEKYLKCSVNPILFILLKSSVHLGRQLPNAAQFSGAGAQPLMLA